MDFKDFRNGNGPYLVGAATILALLLSLIQVLQNAVHRGAAAKAVYAERAATQSQCSFMRGPRERDDCIAQRMDSSNGGAPLLASANTQSY